MASLALCPKSWAGKAAEAAIGPRNPHSSTNSIGQPAIPSKSQRENQASCPECAGGKATRSCQSNRATGRVPAPSLCSPPVLDFPLCLLWFPSPHWRQKWKHSCEAGWRCGGGGRPSKGHGGGEKRERKKIRTAPFFGSICTCRCRWTPTGFPWLLKESDVAERQHFSLPPSSASKVHNCLVSPEPPKQRILFAFNSPLGLKGAFPQSVLPAVLAEGFSPSPSQLLGTMGNNSPEQEKTIVSCI